MRNYLLFSEPMKIGRHEWRVVVYKSEGYLGPKPFTDYEWRSPAWISKTGEQLQAADYWRSMTDWPRYDSNDGMYEGCPKTLRKLYDKYRESIEKALKG